MVWEKDPWKEKWDQARAYYEAHGNLDVPQNYVTEEGVWLGKWLYLQRSRYLGEKTGESIRKSQLTMPQIQALESIGMIWLTPAEQAWESAYEKAKAFYQENGHLNVEKGQRTANGFRLDLWLKRQRKCYREGKTKVLSPERMKKLEALGMNWSTEDSS